MRRWGLLAALLPALLLAPAGAHADRGARVVLRDPSPADRSLVQRIRGQTSDLDVQLVEAPDPPLEPRVSDALATAGELSAQLDARIVVWFESAGDSLTLFFSVPGEHRTLVRTMDRVEARGDEGASSSGLLEAAALVTRYVIRALSTGATIGVTLAKPLDVPAATPTALTTRATAATPEPPPAPERPAPVEAIGPPTPLGWFARAGWHLTVDGPDAVLQGAEARAGLSVARWSWGVAGSIDAPAELRDPYGTVRLSRGAIAAIASYALPLGDAFRLSISVEGGGVAYQRDSTSAMPGVAPTPDALDGSALFGSDLGVAYRARWGDVALGVSIGGGIDVVTSAPTIGYSVDGAFVAEHTLRNVQPKALVLMEVTSVP